eukprot:1391618-Amorphochlora_amoeboformis.AAC.1
MASFHYYEMSMLQVFFALLSIRIGFVESFGEDLDVIDRHIIPICQLGRIIRTEFRAHCDEKEEIQTCWFRGEARGG